MIAILLAAVAASFSPPSSTPSGPIFTPNLPPQPSRTLLLLDPRVQRELGLSPEQREAASRAWSSLNRESQRRMAERRKEEDAKEVREPISLDLSDLVPKFLEASEKVLTAAQRRRLGEIRLQLEGIGAFRRDDFVKRLNLDPARAELILEMAKEADEHADARLRAFQDEWSRQEAELDAAIRSGKPAPKGQSYSEIQARRSLQRKESLARLGRERREAQEALIREVRRRVLTRRQGERWGAMLGEPMDWTNPAAAPAAPGTTAAGPAATAPAK